MVLQRPLAEVLSAKKDESVYPMLYIHFSFHRLQTAGESVGTVKERFVHCLDCGS